MEISRQDPPKEPMQYANILIVASLLVCLLIIVIFIALQIYIG